jgi:Replication initiator protein, pSAM2
MTPPLTRAQRLAIPLARDVVRELAVSHGGCIRPVQLRRTDLHTGQAEQVLVPCGNTLASVCPGCAERARTLRAAQCREGWHLDHEPVITSDDPDDEQRMWIEHRAETQQHRDQADETEHDTAEDDEVIGDLDEQITRSGMRGNVLPKWAERRHRSTRRRQDAPDLPRRPVAPRTIGKTYTTPDGKTFRPSMFLTLTCDSYGKVSADGTPADLAAYDYQRAARDALHFAALFDRLIQNLRRFLGYDVQYFAAVEPQRRLAPHVHVAIRGTLSRNELRQVLAATYHQVWWPPADEIRFGDGELPVWHEASGNYLDPATGEVLPTWNQALDAIGPDDKPLHVARFGPKFDAQGVLAGSPDASRCIGYLTKYLTKHVADCHQAQTDAQHVHAGRLAEALRYEPCSPTCANWLRYGVQPKNLIRACGREGAGAGHTAVSISATPGAGSWCPESGPARPWPATGPTARPGSWPPSVFRQPTHPVTPGSRSPRATRTTCHPPSGFCASSPTASAGAKRSTKPDEEPRGNRARSEWSRRGRLHDGCSVRARHTHAGPGRALRMAEYHRTACPEAGRAGRHPLPEDRSLTSLSGSGD